MCKGFCIYVQSYIQEVLYIPIIILYIQMMFSCFGIERNLAMYSFLKFRLFLSFQATVSFLDDLIFAWFIYKYSMFRTMHKNHGREENRNRQDCTKRSRGITHEQVFREFHAGFVHIQFKLMYLIVISYM